MSIHLPERKAEQAFKAYFGAITDLAIRTRFSGAEKSLPELVILCEECEPAQRGENNEVLEWACRMRFVLRSRYIKDDPAAGDGHDLFVGVVADMMADETILTAGLNDYSTNFNFRANLWIPGGRKSSVDDKDLVTELSGTLWLVPSAT